MAELQNLEELQPIPADLGDITSTWLQRQIDECTAPIKADKSLTSDERRERLKPWRAIAQRTTRLVNIIQGIMLSNPDVTFTIEDDESGKRRYYIDAEQIEAVSIKRATHEIPVEAFTHLELIDKLREAVENLRAFEDKYNVRRYTVEQLLHMPWTNGLCDMWVTGSILRDAVEERYKNFFPTYKQSKEYFQHKQQIKNQ